METTMFTDTARATEYLTRLRPGGPIVAVMSIINPPVDMNTHPGCALSGFASATFVKRTEVDWVDMGNVRYFHIDRAICILTTVNILHTLPTTKWPSLL